MSTVGKVRYHSRRGRWPADPNNPSEAEIRAALETVTLLIRDIGKQGTLKVVDTDGVDIYETDIANLSDSPHGTEEVKGLKVVDLWYGRVPIGGCYAQDIRVTIEDVIFNLGKFTPNTLVEVWVWGADIAYDERLKTSVWKPIFITYVRES